MNDSYWPVTEAEIHSCAVYFTVRLLKDALDQELMGIPYPNLVEIVDEYILELRHELPETLTLQYPPILLPLDRDYYRNPELQS